MADFIKVTYMHFARYLKQPQQTKLPSTFTTQGTKQGDLNVENCKGHETTNQKIPTDLNTVLSSLSSPFQAPVKNIKYKYSVWEPPDVPWSPRGSPQQLPG